MCPGVIVEGAAVDSAGREQRTLYKLVLGDESQCAALPTHCARPCHLTELLSVHLGARPCFSSATALQS